MATSTTSSTSSPSKPKKSTNALAKTWLILYNLLSMLAWAYCLYRLVLSLNPGSSKIITTNHVYAEIGPVVRYTQTAAILEILHSLLRIVKSPLPTTIIQVFSRLLLVYPICHSIHHTEAIQSVFYSSMVLAWSVTEIIRYGYYLLVLVGVELKIVTWLRYTLFFILYPLGAGSEAALIYISIGSPLTLLHTHLPYVLYAILAVYVPGFYIMYTHMIRQRKKVLKGHDASKKKKKL